MIFPHRCLATWPRSTASVQVGRVFPVAGAIIVTAFPKGARSADFSPQDRRVCWRFCGLKSALLSKTRLLGQALVRAVCLRACLKITWSHAARDFGCGQGGEVRAGLACGASPQRAVTTEPTQATDKRPAARRVFAKKAAWLRCSSVTDRWRVCSLVAPRQAAFFAKIGLHGIFRHALSSTLSIPRFVNSRETANSMGFLIFCMSRKSMTCEKFSGRLANRLGFIGFLLI